MQFKDVDVWDKAFRFRLYGDPEQIDELMKFLVDYPVAIGVSGEEYIRYIDTETDCVMICGDSTTIDDVHNMLIGYEGLVAYGICAEYDKKQHLYYGTQFMANFATQAYVSMPLWIPVEDEEIIFDQSNTSMHLYGVREDDEMKGSI